MTSISKLRSQNGEICELSRVLSILVRDNSVCDTQIVRELFRRFVDSVLHHLAMEEGTLYAKLLNHQDSDLNNLSSKYLENSADLKRFFLKYQRQWCKASIQLDGNDEFVEDTNALLRLILQRMSAENEEFFPAVDRVSA